MKILKIFIFLMIFKFQIGWKLERFLDETTGENQEGNKDGENKVAEKEAEDKKVDDGKKEEDKKEDNKKEDKKEEVNKEEVKKEDKKEDETNAEDNNKKEDKKEEVKKEEVKKEDDKEDDKKKDDKKEDETKDGNNNKKEEDKKNSEKDTNNKKQENIEKDDKKEQETPKEEKTNKLLEVIQQMQKQYEELKQDIHQQHDNPNNQKIMELLKDFISKEQHQILNKQNQVETQQNQLSQAQQNMTAEKNSMLQATTKQQLLQNQIQENQLTIDRLKRKIDEDQSLIAQYQKENMHEKQIIEENLTRFQTDNNHIQQAELKYKQELLEYQHQQKVLEQQLSDLRKQLVFQERTETDLKKNNDFNFSTANQYKSELQQYKDKLSGVETQYEEIKLENQAIKKDYLLEKEIRTNLMDLYKKFSDEKNRLEGLRQEVTELESRYHHNYKNFQKFKTDVNNLDMIYQQKQGLLEIKKDIIKKRSAVCLCTTEGDLTQVDYRPQLSSCFQFIANNTVRQDKSQVIVQKSITSQSTGNGYQVNHTINYQKVQHLPQKRVHFNNQQQIPLDIDTHNRIIDHHNKKTDDYNNQVEIANSNYQEIPQDVHVHNKMVDHHNKKVEHYNSKVEQHNNNVDDSKNLDNQENFQQTDILPQEIELNDSFKKTKKTIKQFQTSIFISLFESSSKQTNIFDSFLIEFVFFASFRLIFAFFIIDLILHFQLILQIILLTGFFLQIIIFLFNFLNLIQKLLNFQFINFNQFLHRFLPQPNLILNSQFQVLSDQLIFFMINQTINQFAIYKSVAFQLRIQKKLKCQLSLLNAIRIITHMYHISEQNQIWLNIVIFHQRQQIKNFRQISRKTKQFHSSPETNNIQDHFILDHLIKNFYSQFKMLLCRTRFEQKVTNGSDILVFYYGVRQQVQKIFVCQILLIFFAQNFEQSPIGNYVQSEI